MSNQSAKPEWREGHFTSPEVDQYLYDMLPARDEVLTEMEDDAGKNDVPIVGPAVARILYQLAVISGAKKIFEMGSAIGYSTIWWARAVGDGGRVIYTDGDPTIVISKSGTTLELLRLLPALRELNSPLIGIIGIATLLPVYVPVAAE